MTFQEPEGDKNAGLVFVRPPLETNMGRAPHDSVNGGEEFDGVSGGRQKNGCQ